MGSLLQALDAISEYTHTHTFWAPLLTLVNIHLCRKGAPYVLKRVSLRCFRRTRPGRRGTSRTGWASGLRQSRTRYCTSVSGALRENRAVVWRSMLAVNITSHAIMACKNSFFSGACWRACVTLHWYRFEMAPCYSCPVAPETLISRHRNSLQRWTEPSARMPAQTTCVSPQGSKSSGQACAGLSMAKRARMDIRAENSAWRARRQQQGKQAGQTGIRCPPLRLLELLKAADSREHVCAGAAPE